MWARFWLNKSSSGWTLFALIREKDIFTSQMFYHKQKHTVAPVWLKCFLKLSMSTPWHTTPGALGLPLIIFPSSPVWVLLSDYGCHSNPCELHPPSQEPQTLESSTLQKLQWGNISENVSLSDKEDINWAGSNEHTAYIQFFFAECVCVYTLQIFIPCSWWILNSDWLEGVN